jgi:tape measure domain-containing protein
MAGEVKIKIEVDGAEKAQQQVNSVNSAINGAGKNSLVGSMFSANVASQAFVKGIELVAGGIKMATDSAISFVKQGVQVAANLESMKMGFVTLLGSAKAADSIMTKIKVEAARTPFTITGLTESVQMLSAITKNGDKALSFILDVGEGLAAMGRGQEELSRIVVNLQQVGAIGYAQMIDIKQFAYAGIPIFDMLKKQTGLTGEALNDFISNQGVTFDMLAKMFDKANDKGGQFFEAYKNQAGTFNQLTSNLGDSWDIFSANFVETTGIMSFSKEIINKLIVLFDKLQSGLGKLMQNKDVKIFFDNLMKVFSSLASFMIGSLIGTFEFFGRVLERISPSLNRIFDIFVKISGILSQIITGNQIDQLGKGLEDTFTNALIVTLDLIANGLEKFYNWLQSPEGQQSIRDVKTLVEGLLGAFKTFFQWINSDDAKAMKLGLSVFFDTLFLPLRLLIESLQLVNRLYDEFLKKTAKKGNTTTGSGWSGTIGAVGASLGSGGSGGSSAWFHDGGFIPDIAGGNVPIVAQSGEFVIPKKIVDEIKRGDIYNNSNVKTNTVNINVQGEMNRSKATDTGFLFSNFLARI